MVEFSDILYGTVKIPEWMIPFLKLPEFVRLRGVRLSNIDSYQFKDFNGPTRWDHCIAVAALALRCAERRGLADRERVHLALAGLLHDVATPPFAHTAEYILEDFDHEIESQRVLGALPDQDFQPDFPVFASQLPQFQKACRALATRLRLPLDADEIARMVVGEGDLGFLIRGTLDLDNADNVTRACLFLGVDVDRHVPLRIADWLAAQPNMPTDLQQIAEPAIGAWRQYRKELYHRFYTSSEEELGRQAFLQHLMRRALRAGLPRQSLIWSTDELLLSAIETIDDAQQSDPTPSLRELVQRYRLMESPVTVARIDIENEEVLRALRPPGVATWIENQMSTPSLESLVMLSARRYAGGSDNGSLFPPAPGAILFFKLGQGLKREQLPAWLRKELPDSLQGRKLLHAISQAISTRTSVWIRERPWLNLSPERKTHIVANLKNAGNWGFRLSRNVSMHPYPSTFVHAIPASLILSLGLRGELVIDPFGGTGQTAVEVLKYGGQVISADSNTIACLVARARLTYLSSKQREMLRSLTRSECIKLEPCPPPKIDFIEKWFHTKTLDELCRIRRFLQTRADAPVRQFLTACFSAVIPLCTARRGEQHGYFADNAPLPKGQLKPPYQNAAEAFVARVARNIDLVERLYAFIERDGRSPEVELRRATVVQLDAKTAGPSDYGVDEHSVAGIITSPPYLCMSDYTLGQRLSYYWTAPDALQVDFEREIGARRQRSRPEQATEAYFEGLREFARQAVQLLRPGGFLATVLAAPVAKAFRSLDVLEKLDAIWSEEGFHLLWQQWRPIHWHRNHGYERLKRERVAVHVVT